jgi:hypothetical protein
MSLQKFKRLLESGKIEQIFAEPVIISANNCFWNIVGNHYVITDLGSGCIITKNKDLDIAIKHAEGLISNDKTWPERAIKEVESKGLLYPINENKTVIK